MTKEICFEWKGSIDNKCSNLVRFNRAMSGQARTVRRKPNPASVKSAPERIRTTNLLIRSQQRCPFEDGVHEARCALMRMNKNVIALVFRAIQGNDGRS